MNALTTSCSPVRSAIFPAGDVSKGLWGYFSGLRPITHTGFETLEGDHEAGNAVTARPISTAEVLRIPSVRSVGGTLIGDN